MRHQLKSISFYPKIVKNYNKLLKIFRNKNTLRYKNYNKSIDIFWFAHKGNSLPSEQNKIGLFKDNLNQFRHQLKSIIFGEYRQIRRPRDGGKKLADHRQALNRCREHYKRVL